MAKYIEIIGSRQGVKDQSNQSIIRVVKKISSSRRIRESNRHWGPETPSWVQGQCEAKQIWVFMLAEIGSPELRAMLTREVSVFE